uniref:Malonyl-CoA:ACP transacylase (MAT) domain-containing protein n=1 Tax=Megaselia scalaris TaxID=36166 RepID=T1GZ55_MEGSC
MTSNEKRPLVWFFGGMATQWKQMGIELMKIVAFKETIERCHTVLQAKNLDLKYILTGDDDEIFESNLRCCVGIGAVQIGLVNILKEIEVKPDYLLGISFGEVATAYADGCLTEEEAILSAYFRGLAVTELKALGRTSLIGLNSEELRKVLPEDCDIATFLDPDAYVAPVAPKMLENIKTVISEPKKRSDIWVSTSVHPEEWKEPKARTASAEYFVSNFSGSVYLEQACRYLPKNSVILEIAPHCLLKTTMEKNFPEGKYAGLSFRDSPKTLEVFQNALKTLSENGVELNWVKINTVFNGQ